MKHGDRKTTKYEYGKINIDLEICIFHFLQRVGSSVGYDAYIVAAKSYSCEKIMQDAIEL